MPLTIEATTSGGLGADVYDFILSKAELVDGQYGQQIKLVWIIDGETDSAGDPKTQYDWVPASWGNAERANKLRQRVPALVGGKLNPYLDAVLCIDPGAIDLEWLYGNRIQANWGERPKVDRKGNPVGGTKMDILSALPVRATAGEAQRQFLADMQANHPEVHAKAAAIAGIAVNGGGGTASPSKNGVRPGAPVALPVDTDDNMPF